MNNVRNARIVALLTVALFAIIGIVSIAYSIGKNESIQVHASSQSISHSTVQITPPVPVAPASPVATVSDNSVRDVAQNFLDALRTRNTELAKRTSRNFNKPLDDSFYYHEWLWGGVPPAFDRTDVLLDSVITRKGDKATVFFTVRSVNADSVLTGSRRGKLILRRDGDAFLASKILDAEAVEVDDASTDVLPPQTAKYLHGGGGGGFDRQ